MTYPLKETAMRLVLKFNHKFETRACEWLAACVLIGWGVVLSLNDSTFEDGANYYWTLARLFPQEVWALATLIVGIARFVALYINGALKSTPFVRMSMAFISCFFWYQIALGLLLAGIEGGIWNTGLPVYTTLLVFEAYNVFRASIDARIIFDEVRALNNGTVELGK